MFASSTTLTSTGAVNSFHDSFTPLGGGIAIVDMMTGEIAPGGVGSGLYGILVIAIISVFVAGLMVGRTPEYLGKKIQAREIKLASLYILATPACVLVGTGIAMALPGERAGMLNSGPHGLSEVLYAFTSAANNNGSAFAGISVNTVWYNTALGLVMLLARFLPDRVRPGAGRLAGPAGARAGHRRHAAHPPAAVRRPGHRRDRHRRRPDLLPRHRARPARRRRALKHGQLPEHPGDRRRRCPMRVVKLDPRVMVKNPVMFVVEVGSVLTTYLAIVHPSVFAWSIVVWLWLTVVFANLAEAVAEGRGKAQAETLRRARTDTTRPRARPGGSSATRSTVLPRRRCRRRP